MVERLQMTPIASAIFMLTPVPNVSDHRTREPQANEGSVVAVLGNSLSLFFRFVEGFGAALAVALVLRMSHRSFHTSRSVENLKAGNQEGMPRVSFLKTPQDYRIPRLPDFLISDFSQQLFYARQDPKVRRGSLSHLGVFGSYLGVSQSTLCPSVRRSVCQIHFS